MSDLIKGEGETKIVRRTKVRACCEVCGEPATRKRGYDMPNARRNPQSSSYGRDDTSWCSDHDVFICDDCPTNKLNVPEGYTWGNEFNVQHFPHLFLEWLEEDVTSEFNKTPA